MKYYFISAHFQFIVGQDIVIKFANFIMKKERGYVDEEKGILDEHRIPTYKEIWKHIEAKEEVKLYSLAIMGFPEETSKEKITYFFT